MNSRTKGHQFERDIAFRLREELWPNCQTSRFMGRLFDDHSGVDLTGTPGFNIQCKALEHSPAYHDILNSMPKGINTNIVIHKKNNRGIVVAMVFEDFIRLLKNCSKY